MPGIMWHISAYNTVHRNWSLPSNCMQFSWEYKQEKDDCSMICEGWDVGKTWVLCDSREKPLSQIEELKKLLRQMRGHMCCIWSDDWISQDTEGAG